MAHPELRPVAEPDLPALVPLLEGAFSGHQDGLDWHLELLQGFWDWRWGQHGLSRLAPGDDGPAGVALADLRPARWQDTPLAAVHVGPVGVHPDAWGRGLGTALMAGVEAAAVDAGADLLTLTTEQRHRAHRLYSRLGYAVVETGRPRVAILDGPGLLRGVGLAALAPVATPLSLGWLRTIDGVRAEDGCSGERGPRRAGSIQEQALPTLPPAVPSRSFTCGQSRVAVALLPAVSRTRGRHTLRVAQVLGAQGRGPSLRAAAEAGLAWARDAGCATAFALPAAGPVPRVWLPLGPRMLRMAKALSPAGHAALDAASAWDEWAPAS